jgi:hypothetical protein
MQSALHNTFDVITEMMDCLAESESQSRSPWYALCFAEAALAAQISRRSSSGSGAFHASLNILSPFAPS